MVIRKKFLKTPIWSLSKCSLSPSLTVPYDSRQLSKIPLSASLWGKVVKATIKLAYLYRPLSISTVSIWNGRITPSTNKHGQVNAIIIRININWNWNYGVKFCSYLKQWYITLKIEWEYLVDFANAQWMVKFMFSKKVKISSIFVAFLENTNFNVLKPKGPRGLKYYKFASNEYIWTKKIYFHARVKKCPFGNFSERLINWKKRGDKNRTKGKKGCNRDHPFITSAKELDGWVAGLRKWQVLRTFSMLT